ncbi:MAG: periplasmic sensor signal transduction histidine kinase [Candidatus Acidoferrum typicum]|nr:periplasmic sensor signal transduction histidine kinase [Candidatus Acidoferrum typicum]
MKLMIKERAFTTGMTILAVVVVIVLGVLQYRWSNQVSEATSIRLADSLEMSMVNWHLDFFRDFSEICIAMRVDPETDAQDDWNQYARRFDDWKKSTAHPNLVSGLYIFKFDGASQPKTLRLDPGSQRFESSDWPANFADLRGALQEAFLKSESAGAPSRASEFQDTPSQTSDREFADRFYAGGALAGWQFEPGIPALVRPVARDASASADRSSASRTVVDWIVIALNRKDVQEHILPDLAQRYFRGTEGLDYQVAVVVGNKSPRSIYSSDRGFGEQEVVDADGTMNIFGRLQDQALGSPIHIFHTPSQNKGPAAAVGITWFPLVRETAEDLDWRLIVRHRRGGALGAFVADSHRRDLAISFGVLLLLVISMAILIITSTRAQRLAKLQMDFVTAVSHELRTPLTVISSAAENIAHGVVEGKQQLAQYGTVIGNQARKLFEMVEQILLFAAIREGHQRYSLRQLSVAEIIDSALSGTAGLIQEARFKVEQDIEQNLPQVSGDLSALSQCLQNLITNALKYGSQQHWIGIQARFAEHGLRGKEIEISISDRGIGIESADLPHIFEPFYRSPLVAAAQIHGTGLGLPLAKSIAEAMKGELTVKSVPGRGSTFTLHLPCSERPVRQADPAMKEAVSS